MPFEQLELGKLIGGTLLAFALGGIHLASAQTAGITTISIAGTYIGTAQSNPADGSFNATISTVPAASDKHMMLVPTVQGRLSNTGLVAEYGTRGRRYLLEATRS